MLWSHILKNPGKYNFYCIITVFKNEVNVCTNNPAETNNPEGQTNNPGESNNPEKLIILPKVIILSKLILQESPKLIILSAN